MKRYRQQFCVLLSLLLLLGLAACNGVKIPNQGNSPSASGARPETQAADPGAESLPETQSLPSTETQTEAPVGTEPGTPAAQSSAAPTEEATEPETEPPADDELPDFADDEAMRSFLVGVWNYFPTEEDAAESPGIDGIPGVSIQLMDDGSFFAIRHTDNAQFFGSWELERYFAEEDELPDRLSFVLDDAAQPGAFGSYWIQNWADCADTDRLSVVRLSYNTQTFGSYPDAYDAMLVKGGFSPDAEGAAPKTDAAFCGMVWQVSENGGELWITEISPTDFSVTLGSHKAACYKLASDAELVWPASVFARGGCPAVVKTNAAGEIVFLDWAEAETEGNG